MKSKTSRQDKSGAWRQVRKIGVLVGGSILLLVGVALIFLPGPAVVFLAGGFGLLATEFQWARQWARKAKQWLKQGKAKAKQIKDRLFRNSSRNHVRT